VLWQTGLTSGQGEVFLLEKTAIMSREGRAKSDSFDDEAGFYQRECFYKTLLSVIKPEITPYLEYLYEVKELLSLSEIISAGENQLHHVIRMLEIAVSIPDSVFEKLNISREELVIGVIFHDVGKGKEVDDRYFDSSMVTKSSVPVFLRHYPGMNWAEWVVPFHNHIAAGYLIAKKYHCSIRVLEAIALHHHVKIRPRTLNLLGDSLKLSSMVKLDIFHYNPIQYAAPGGNLAQVIAILDQLCAIERKFRGFSGLGLEPQQLEYEVVRDLVIGITDNKDPRLDALGTSLNGNESVILFDLKAFGSFVKMHTEYEVQNIKATILQLIRNMVRVNRIGKERDLVALIGGDEYAVITKVEDAVVLSKMAERVADVIKLKTGFQVRAGYGIGGSIAENYHKARLQAELMKKHRFLVDE
jgi:GGDEF domain-containing protein